MRTNQQKNFEANRKSLDDLKAIAASGVKVLIPGHTGLIKVTQDLLRNDDVAGYTLTAKSENGICQTFAAHYK